MAKNDQILDFQVSMESSHKDASGGVGGVAKSIIHRCRRLWALPKTAAQWPEMIRFGFSSVYGIIS